MVVEFLLGKMRNFTMIVKNRTLKQVNSDWVSPTYIEQELDYGANEWINLTTLQDFNDNDYAIVDDGVKIGVPSQKINCYGFEFNLPETEIFSKKIEVRFLVIDGTVGGGNIKDYYIKINNNVLTPQSTFWTDQITCIRNYSTEIYRSTVNVDGDLINDLSTDDVTVSFACIGTGNDVQTPMIYGVQARVVYEYYEWEETEEKPIYKTVANIDKYEIADDPLTLSIDRYCTNSMTGVYGTLEIELSDNLRFVDNKNKKVIVAENLEPYEVYTNKFKVFGKQDGLGTITISSVSIDEDITLYVLVKNNIYYNDHFTVLNGNYFLQCTAESLGGGIYNNSYLNISNTTYNGNVNGDLYQAQTKMDIYADNEFEINKKYNFQVKVSVVNGRNVTNGSIEIRSDKYSSYIAKEEVNEKGVAEFEDVVFSKIGKDTLRFNYIPADHTYEYGTSKEYHKVNIKHKKTHLKVYENTVEHNDFLKIQLIDSDDRIITGETIIYNDNKFVINDDGYAYIMMLNPLGDYKLTFTYNGNDVYEPCELKEDITIRLKRLNIIAEDLYARKNYKSVFTVTLNDEDGIPLASKKVDIDFYNPFKSQELKSIDDKITVEDFVGKGVKSYSVNSDSTGKVNIEIEYDNTTMNNVLLVKTEFKSDGVYESNKTYNIINFYESGIHSTEIILNDTNIKSVVGESTIIEGQLKDIVGNSGLWKNTYDNTVYNIYVLCINQTNGKIYFYQTTTEYDGNFKVTIDELPIGKYTYKCIFTGTEAYDGSIIADVLDVYESGDKPTIIESSDYSGNINSIKPFGIYLLDENKVPLEDRKIHFSVKDSNQKVNTFLGVTDSYGYCEYEMAYASGVYLIETSFLGDEEYESTLNKNIFIINEKTDRNNTSVKITNNIVDNNDDTFVCNYDLKNDFNMINDYLTLVSYDENGYYDIRKIATGKNGTGSVKITPKSTVTVINSIFTGNANYPAYEYLSLIYKKDITGITTNLINKNSNIEFFENEEIYFETTLEDENGKLLQDEIVVLEIIHSDNSRSVHFKKTDDSGNVSLLLDLSPNTYICNAYYIGSSDYKSCMSTAKIIVNKNANLINTYLEAESTDMEMFYDVNNDGHFTVTLKAEVEPTTDENVSVKKGKILSNKPISFLIQNKNGEMINDNDLKYIYTDSEGKANLPIDQYKGEYDIKFDFYGDDEYNQSSGKGTITINVTNEIETLIEVYDTEIKYEENKNMFIRLVDKSNNPITNEILNIKIIDDLTNNEILNTSNGTDIFGLLNVTGGIRTDETSGRIKIPLKNIHTGSYTVVVDYNGNRLQYMYGNEMKIVTFTPFSKTVKLNIKPKDNLEDIYLKPEKNYYKTTYELDSKIHIDINQYSEWDNHLPSNSKIIDDYVIFDFYNRANKRFTYTARIQSSINEDGYTDYFSEFDLGVLYGGIYDCYIRYPTQTDYKEYEVSIVVEVEAKPTVLLLFPNNKNHKTGRFSYMSDETIQVKLTHEDGITPIKNEYLIFNINGVNYSTITNENGIGEIAIKNLDLNIGTYELNVWNIADNNFYSTKTNGTIIIEKSTLKVDYLDEVRYLYGENYNYEVNVKYYQINRGGNSSTPVPINNLSVTLSTEIDGIKYVNTQSSDEMGNVFFKNIPLTIAETYNCSLNIKASNLDEVNVDNIRLIVDKNVPQIQVYYNDLLYNLTSTLNVNGVGIPNKDLKITVGEDDGN